jgi:hypothetical protein
MQFFKNTKLDGKPPAIFGILLIKLPKTKKPFPLYWSTSGKAASNYIEKEFLI